MPHHLRHVPPGLVLKIHVAHPSSFDATNRGPCVTPTQRLSALRICGTQDLHRKLESAVSRFLGTEDTILYSSCFDANAAIFETLLGPEDAIISDALNHASIIDGIRLSKAKRRIVRHGDIDDYRASLGRKADKLLKS